MSEGQLLPSSRCCFLCGSENPHGLHLHVETCDGLTRLRCTPSDRLQGFPGVVHGGFVAMFLDEVIGIAVGLARGGICVTRRLEIEYLKPVKVGEALVVEGWPTREAGGHLYGGEGVVRTEAGQVLARAEAEFAVMSRKVLQRVFGIKPEQVSPDDPLR